MRDSPGAINKDFTIFKDFFISSSRGPKIMSNAENDGVSGNSSAAKEKDT